MPTINIPLSLYVHIPWCIRKCPYCDFNSHELKNTLPEENYIAALLDDLNFHLPLLDGRLIEHIFFGGGTPSLFSPQAIKTILEGIQRQTHLSADAEITLEANPGTVDANHFIGYKNAGINRLSLGVQSLQDTKLQALGRIHNKDSALNALEAAQTAGFSNINIDLMYGLPNQSLDESLQDLQAAINCTPVHLSWYQLTLEPNTLFHHKPPPLPDEDKLWDIQVAGQALLAANNFNQYEVSAYARTHFECKHNMNYWSFGDYLGIGAGAHSKITCLQTLEMQRFAQIKHPRDYLCTQTRRYKEAKQILGEEDKIFEFMLNALRLTKGIPADLFTERTGIAASKISNKLQMARHKGLLIQDEALICPSELGRKFLNNLVSIFLTNLNKSDAYF